MKYDQDTRVRLSAQFRDFNEDLTDPDTVTLKLRTPAGAETSVTPGVPPKRKPSSKRSIKWGRGTKSGRGGGL